MPDNAKEAIHVSSALVESSEREESYFTDEMGPTEMPQMVSGNYLSVDRGEDIVEIFKLQNAKKSSRSRHWTERKGSTFFDVTSESFLKDSLFKFHTIYGEEILAREFLFECRILDKKVYPICYWIKEISNTISNNELKKASHSSSEDGNRFQLDEVKKIELYQMTYENQIFFDQKGFQLKNLKTKDISTSEQVLV